MHESHTGTDIISEKDAPSVTSSEGNALSLHSWPALCIVFGNVHHDIMSLEMYGKTLFLRKKEIYNNSID